MLASPSGAFKSSQEATGVDRPVQSAAGACDVITETGGNAGSNRAGCSPVSPLQAEAAGIIREAQDFCRQYESPEELAKYPVASLVLRLAHALKQLADELDRRCPRDPDYEHNAAEVAKAHRQWREAAAIPAFCKPPDFAT